jgi:hypothetical protein
MHRFEASTRSTLTLHFVMSRLKSFAFRTKVSRMLQQLITTAAHSFLSFALSFHLALEGFETSAVFGSTCADPLLDFGKLSQLFFRQGLILALLLVLYALQKILKKLIYLFWA